MTVKVSKINKISEIIPVKPYAPTDKEELKPVSFFEAVGETVDSVHKIKDFLPVKENETYITHSGSYLIDKKNPYSTSIHLDILNNFTKKFQHTERNSLGKKFVIDGI